MAVHLLLLAVNTISPGLNGLVRVYSDCLGALSWTAELPPYRVPSRCSYRHSDILKTILVNCGGLTFSRKYCHVEAHQDVIGHGLMLLLSIVKWRNLLNSQLLVYDGDRQAPPDLSNLLTEGTDLDPDERLMHHKSIPAFPHRNTSASLNRRSFGSKRYF